MKPKKKAAKKKLAKKSRGRIAPKASKSKLRPPPPPSLRGVRVAVLPEVFLEYLRSRGLLLTPFDAEACVPVKFYDKGKLNHPKASRTAGDHVCFENKGKVDRTLTLDYWPFEGDPRAIFVPAGGTVGPFRLNPDDTFIGTVTASADPPFEGAGGPGDPGFDVDG